MNIHEIEVRTGLERANIRYYEKEGLLKPSRLLNGYRDYCEADVETLLRIKLLRELEVSVAEIARLQTNETVLQDVIASRLEMLQRERAALARERKICETIQLDGACYDTLKAEQYLNQLDELRRLDWGIDSAAGWGSQTEHLKGDVAPLDLRPGQRLMARGVDILLYHMLWLLLYYVVCRIPFEWNDYMLWNQLIFAFLLQIFLEPTLISGLGGTLGHFLIGMRVHTYQGTKLTWGQAWIRLWSILWKAPMIVSRRPLWQSQWYNEWYGDYWPLNPENGFPWDENTTYSFVDEKGWRLVALAGCGAAFVLGIGTIFSGAQDLKHQGPMTIEEFAENYNKYVEVSRGGAEYQLDTQGQWVKSSSGTGYIYVFDGSWGTESRFPQLEYMEENGYLTGISFETHHQGEAGETIPGNRSMMVNLVMSYVVPYLGHQSPAWLEAQINQNYMKTYSIEVGDLTVSWKIKTAGYVYNNALGMFEAMEYPFDYDYSYDITFWIQPTGL